MKRRSYDILSQHRICAAENISYETGSTEKCDVPYSKMRKVLWMKMTRTGQEESSGYRVGHCVAGRERWWQRVRRLRVVLEVVTICVHSVAVIVLVPWR